MISGLTEHFFRHEYGRLVAMLVRRLGAHRLETIEDAVQSALVAALESWTVGSIPDNPSAWLFRVAHNRMLDELRRQARHNHVVLQKEVVVVADATENGPHTFPPGDVQDDLLRMLFACCERSIPDESQLVIALKTLCGFDVSEIAERLFTSEANVYKRLGRARSRLRELKCLSVNLSPEEFSARLSGVRSILYLLFTEGYLSSCAETAIRQELCEEAIRLTHILSEHPAGSTPETHALLALMHLHLARMAARQDGAGRLLLLEEQDRSRWDQREIEVGLHWLAKSANGNNFSRYHAEAGIAAEHCLALSYGETRWDRIAECYALWEQFAPSPVHMLNRAVAIAEWRGPVEGLAVLDGLEPPSWLAGSYLWSAVLADLHRRCGHDEAAQHYHDTAMKSAPSAAVGDLLQRRLETSRETRAR